MAEYDCRSCKMWKGCKGKAWYDFGEIHWCPQQNFWLLKYADILHQGEWPTPDATAPGGMSGKPVSGAAFTRVVLVIAELDMRLSKTGWRGRLLAEECKNRYEMDDLSHDAKDALYYVAGWRRKEMDFNEWRKKRRYRVHQKVVMGAI